MAQLVVAVLAGSIWLLIAAGPASADNGPHVAGAGSLAGSCGACHRVHASKAPSLLKEAEPGLCMTCHGSSTAGASTDVEDGVGYSGTDRTGTPGALRGGGFSYALIDSANPTGQGAGADNLIPARSSGAPVTSTHSADSSDQVAWGSGAVSATADYGKTIQLRCSSCHDPHGNGNFRTLKPIPTDSGAAGGVTIPDATTKVYTTTNYWNVDDANAPGFVANVADWCSTCHTRYLAGAGSGSVDSGDVVYQYRHRSDSTGADQANCIQCHVAHGSNAQMSGTYSSRVASPDGSGTPDSSLLRIDNRGVCQMCHAK